MRIVIDFQGAQTGSRFRGIGLYATEIVRAMIAEAPEHEFFLVLNGAFQESIEPIRAAFADLLPQSHIRTWYANDHVENFDVVHGGLREVSQIMREFYLRSLDPDVILLTSVFEALGEPAVITVKEYVKDTPVVSIFYDFTPLILPNFHTRRNHPFRAWYRQRVTQIAKSDLIFAISESSRDEFHHFVDYPRENTFNIFGGHSNDFAVRRYSTEKRAEILSRLGIDRPFLLYAGGLEPNKNLQRLVSSLARLPAHIKQSHAFVVVGKRNPGEEERILSFAADGLSRAMINVAGYVSREDLIDLYNLCDLFVFPSLREGLGLPAIEAMACGAPTIVSDRSSLPEVVLDPAAHFDPEDEASIAQRIEVVLTDERLRTRLVKAGLERAGTLTWQNSARTLLRALDDRITPRRRYDDSRRTIVVSTSQFVEKPRRILAFKLDHNGDFLLSLPAFNKLRARYPDARLDVVVGSWNLAAAEATGLFDNIFTLDYFKAKSSVRASLAEDELHALLANLPFYDIAIDLRRQSESRFLLIQAPAKAYFGYDTGEHEIDRLLTNPLPRFPEPSGVYSRFDASHTVDQLLRLIDQLPFANSDYLAAPAPEVKATVRPGTVAIFPRVGNDSRQWDTDRFAALIDNLAANPNVREINLYGGSPAEIDTVPFMSSPKIALHAGLRYPDLLASLASNQVCVGNNSFGVHLGSYAGCTTIGIYSGHELPEHWGPPFGNAYAITADAPCSPCHLPDKQSCPYDTFCLKDIAVPAVERMILDALAGREIREDFAKIVPSNPASVVRPLLTTLSRQAHRGKIGGLEDADRTRLAASIAINFPERRASERTVYLDVSGLRADNPSRTRTEAKLTELRTLAEQIAKSRGNRESVVFVASGQHDHELYEIPTSALIELDRNLLDPRRNQRVVRPIAGDVYIGPDVYTGRNPAQWALLAAWRQAGVRVTMQAPQLASTLMDAEDKQAAPAYLYRLSHLDAIIAAPGELDLLNDWLAANAPPRARPLDCFERPSASAGLTALIPALLGDHISSTGKVLA